MIISFTDIPKQKPKKMGPTSHTIWNTKKPEGWKTYETPTENDDVFQNLINVESPETTGDMALFEKKLKKVKFSSFGKVKIR